VSVFVQYVTKLSFKSRLAISCTQLSGDLGDILTTSP